MIFMLCHINTCQLGAVVTGHLCQLCFIIVSHWCRRLLDSGSGWLFCGGARWTHRCWSLLVQVSVNNRNIHCSEDILVNEIY